MKIAVAMSGGVDSSVAALLLKDQGHDIFGISMQLADGVGGAGAAERRCCGVRDILDARRVAGQIGIPFYVANMKELFSREVVQPFAEAYASGATPIPCMACNDRLKFGVLLSRVIAMGADALATGHYVRTELRAGRWHLLRAVDRDRDQSYFLYQLTAPQLERLVFPLGGMHKSEVRNHARRAGLGVGDKPDSQEICFVPDGDHARVVEDLVPVTAGEIRDLDGRVLGRHAGVHRFTVGQRRGLGIASGSHARYVIDIDPDAHTIRVGASEDLLSRQLLTRNASWVTGPPPERHLRADVRIRSRHAEAPAALAWDGVEGVAVTFDAPQRGIAPGQAAVFYDGDEVLGGGTIVRVPPGDREMARPGSGLVQL